MESAERSALREKKQLLQDELTTEADQVALLRQEMRASEAPSPKKAEHAERSESRAREEFLKSQLEELEATLKKVKADLRRSQEVATRQAMRGLRMQRTHHKPLPKRNMDQPMIMIE